MLRGTASFRFVVVLATLLVFGLSPGMIAGQESSGEVTVVAEARFTVDDPPPAPLDAHQLVLEFAPGAVAALHQHGGPGFITMLTGELSLIADGEAHIYRAGDDFIEVPESLYEGTNLTAEPATLMVTYLVPAGHQMTTYVNASSGAQTAPPPQVVTQAMFEIPEPPSDYEVVHEVLDYSSNTWTTSENSAGQTYLTVVQGELAARNEDGGETAYVAGETRTEEQGVTVERGNSGSEPARIVATTLAALDDEATPSRTGLIGLIAAAASVGLVAGGVLLRRKRTARA